MSTKPQYFKIGIFVIIATLIIVAAVVIFGAGLLAKDRINFETYFEESITGLSVGSLVEFRGVRIGQVDRIEFVGNAYDLDQDPTRISEYEPYVRVVCSVVHGNLFEFSKEEARSILEQMIERGLRVRVTSNILTGEAFLEIDYLDPNRFEATAVSWEPKYMYLPSAPSEFNTIKDSIDKILLQLQEIDVGNLVTTLEEVLESIDQAVADANLAEISIEAKALMREARQKVAALDTESINELTQTLLVSLNQTVVDANVPGLSQEAQLLLSEARQTLRSLEAERIGRAAQKLLESLDQAVADANVPALSRETRDLIAELQEDARLINLLLIDPEMEITTLSQLLTDLDTATVHIDRLIATERPEIEVLLANFREISDSLRELTDSLKERPSDLLFSKPPARSEVLK